MSLRLRVNLLVTVLMLLFAIGLGKMVLDDTRSSIREEMEAGTKVTAQLLSGVLYSSRFTGAPRPFMLDFFQQLGRVRANDIRLYDTSTKQLIYASPPSSYKPGRSAPEWYTRLVQQKYSPVSIALPGARIDIAPDASRATLDAWDDLQRVLLLAGGFFVLINALVFWFVSRSLKPVQHILRGLSEMERGKLETRLPEFRLPEFRRIGETFNRMAARLSETISENRRLALAVEQSSDAMLIHGPDGHISFWNSAAERLFGYTREEVTGKPLTMLSTAERRTEAAEQLGAIARRERIDNLWTCRLTKQHKELDVALSAAPLVDPDTDKVVGGICSMRDITMQIHAQAVENELKQNRELSQLIRAHIEEERRGIAQELHDELGQCVTAIRTIAEAIVQRSGQGATENKSAAQIKSQTEIKSQAQSINQIAGRIYSGMHDIVRRLRPTELDILGLRETLKETVAGWAARYPAVDYQLALDEHLEGLSEAVNITIYRLVQEGLTNIARHAGATRVWITVGRQADAALTLSIRDDGHGNVSMAMSAGGFGLLGMRERVQALQGEFSVTGKPNAGTELRAVIPLTPILVEEEIL